MTDSAERIQKVLAALGLASRRAIETWITEGRITVNGKRAQLGDKVMPSDELCVDGKIVHQVNYHDRRVLVYHKPEGVICSRHDPEGRPSVFDRLPRLKNDRWVMVGRLDINTSGLLLFTNDGALAQKLMHPSSNIEREYAVRVLGTVTDPMLGRLMRGVQLEDGMAHFKSIVDGGGTGANHWYHVVLTSGRQREVRRLWESQGVAVNRLIRVRFGQLTLPRSLKVGQYAELNDQEIKRYLTV